MKVFLKILLAITLPVWGLPYCYYQIVGMIMEDAEKERRIRQINRGKS